MKTIRKGNKGVMILAVVVSLIPYCGEAFVSNPFTTNNLSGIAPMHLGTNNAYDASTNLTTLDAISSTFSTSPNSVFGWTLNLTVSNSQGVVVDYARPHYDIPSSEGYTNIPTVVNSDHAFFPYVISTIYSNCANCSVSYSINSIVVNSQNNQNQQIYGVALNAAAVTNNSNFFFGAVGNGNASKNAASSASYALNSEVFNNSVISLHEAYGSIVDGNSDVGIMLADGANVTNNFDAFVGEVHADPDGNMADVNNNISLSALSVPNANDNHQSAITNTVNLFVFGDSTMAGGQVRIEDDGNGTRTVKQYGDHFQAGGAGSTDFKFSTNGIPATYIRFQLSSSNIVVGTTYSNSYGAALGVSGLAVKGVEAAVAGQSALVLGIEGISTNVVYCQLTAVGLLTTGSSTNPIESFIIPTNARWKFTDVSSGAGNSAAGFGGIPQFLLY